MGQFPTNYYYQDRRIVTVQTPHLPRVADTVTLTGNLRLDEYDGCDFKVIKVAWCIRRQAMEDEDLDDEIEVTIDLDLVTQ